MGESDPPSCESRGVWCAIARQTESMVWIFSLCGCCSRFHPRARSLANAARASWFCSGSSPICAAASRSAFSTRSRISAVAARVKVMAKICSGSSTSASSFSSRRVSSSVLPEPAGACTRKELSVSSVRARSV